MTTWWYAPHLDSTDPDERDVRTRLASSEGANLEGSLNEDGTYSIVLDLDCKHEYRPSATKGHGHLVIPAKLTQMQYMVLLAYLEEAGVISHGYLQHAIRRDGQSFVRAPGHLKPEGAGSSDDYPLDATRDYPLAKKVPST